MKYRLLGILALGLLGSLGLAQKPWYLAPTGSPQASRPPRWASWA